MRLLYHRRAAARGGDGAAEFFGGFDPFLNDDFHVGERFLVGLSVGAGRRAAPPVLRVLYIRHPALTRWAKVCRASGARTKTEQAWCGGEEKWRPSVQERRAKPDRYK